MTSTTTLAIQGSNQQPVPNEFIRQDGDADHLIVFLPGFAYTCDMPLFSYAEQAALAAGADLLRVEYAYHRRPEFATLPQSEQHAWLIAAAVAAYRAALAQRSYRAVSLVGKSLGTLAMGHLVSHEATPAVPRAVWLTPPLGNASFRDLLLRCRWPSLLAIGTGDHHYDPALVDQLRAAGHAFVVIPGADHSLDIPGNIPASLAALGQTLAAIQAFLASG